MDGGKFIGEGSYGCAFKKPIKCASDKTSDITNKSYYQNTIGKVFARNQYAEEEYAHQQLVKTIDPNDEWTVSMKKKCTVNKFLKSDEKEDCGLISDSNTQQYTQIIYQDGGKDLDQFADEAYRSKDAVKILKLRAIFQALGPVLRGLRDMNQQGVIHMDLKPGNILFDGTQLRVIDFGLLTRAKELYTETNRNILEFVYPFYGPEFKLYSLTSTLKGLQKEYSKNLRHFRLDVNQPFGVDVQKQFIEQVERFYSIICFKTENLTNKRKCKAEMIKLSDKIDIYSLGATFLDLFTRIEVPFTMETFIMYQFILKMVNANPYERSDWNTIIHDYENLWPSERRKGQVFNAIPQKGKKN